MTLKYFFVLIAFCASFVISDKYLKEKPSFLRPCEIHSSDFSKCMASNFQTVFAQWKDGLPGLSSIGKLDPLLVKRVKIVQDNSKALSLNMDLQNVLVKGASKAVVQDARIDTKSWKIDCKIFIPKLIFDSDYKVKGNVLTLPLNSNGKAQFQSENMLLIVHLDLKLRDSGEHTFTDVEKVDASIKEIGNFHIFVDNLFNGQKELEDAANSLFNENWRELYESLRPAIEQTIGRVLEDRLQKIFQYVPGNYFISDLPKAG